LIEPAAACGGAARLLVRRINLTRMLALTNVVEHRH